MNEEEQTVFNEHEKDVLYEALKEAKKAFDKRIGKEYDPAYFDLDMEGFVLSPHDFSRQSKVVISDLNENEEDSDGDDEKL